MEVEYDNGERERVLAEHVSPQDVPVRFGEEVEPLQVPSRSLSLSYSAHKYIFSGGATAFCELLCTSLRYVSWYFFSNRGLPPMSKAALIRFASDCHAVLA